MSFPLPSGKPESQEITAVIFDSWNEQKKLIQSGISQEKIRIEQGEKPSKKIYINEREIWYAQIGINIGNETHGKKNFYRPVLVIKKVGSLFFVAPMTTHGQDNIYHHNLGAVTYKGGYANIPDVSRVQLSQAKVIDRARMLDQIGTVSVKDFETIKKKLAALLLGASSCIFPDCSGDPEGHL